METRREKEKVKAIVCTLMEYVGRVEALTSELSRAENEAQRSIEFREELADLKCFFRDEFKRLQREEGILSTEISALYRPAVRDAALRFPDLNRPAKWLSGLFEVGSDLRHHLFISQKVLTDLEVVQNHG